MNRELLNRVDHTVDAIIWVTESSISEKTPDFETFRYLFDGVVKPNSDDGMSLFETTQFNKPLLMLHTTNKNKDKNIKYFKDLVNKRLGNEANIITL